MTETFRVLVTDDEEGMRLGVERALSRYVSSHADLDAEVDFQVRTASTGEEALELIKQQVPDILLLDYKLPGLSGLDVLAQLGPYQERMLTVMITAYASLHTAIEATKSGAFDFLSKPFTPEELKATIRKSTRHLILQRRAQSVERERRRARFELISVVSHELKSPLAAIEGFLRLLEEDDGDPETRKRMYGRCLARLDGMRKLIFDLLDLTRIESGQRTREIGPVNLCDAVRAGLEATRPAADARQIALRSTLPESVVLSADAREIEIMVGNLLSNAVKYNRDGGSVEVVVSSSDGFVRLAVSDTGIGMTEAERDRLFGEFVRIKNRDTQNIPGSGLGLSILKRLASLYGGDVTVTSERGVGSTFTVTLAEPAAEGPAS